MMSLADFTNRLRKNQRHWNKWARRRDISCYRLYDRDMPEFPLAVDWYEGEVHVQLFARKGREPLEAPAEKAVGEAVCEALEIPAAALAFKTRQRQRGAAQYEKTGKPGRRRVIGEAGLKFEVDLHSYLDTGLFLDHRETRALIRRRAGGRRMLNLFAYTGSFSVYAAAGGALATTSVDLSNTYLDWTRRNLALNDFTEEEHQLVRSDVNEFLRQARRERRVYGLIVLDPPSFSNSKKMQATLDLQRDHRRLIEACLGLLIPGGELYFSTNKRRFKIDPALASLPACEEITDQTVPDDFKRHPAHRCWIFRHS
ncbi:MAG: oxidoreductase [gamma proteobacterium symbiont of Ctena orbiculata]|uniref:Class I SAM-dependent methyltransferase n=1 Tax=Candidatus Thiodiazotropha taylori TaxID=2792791 RepID=A0A944M4P1_9GAMM|nr:class I SAM-dependent methyltransferase [Candidatus Thiodiazotropha taylori]PUB89078.1 MAG: oxidoreductase [gamma proteobacterium symbiont of Ctena orbiculata]MBT2987456.1 class I SAM-dependent methyltransferase [Candidatus Thiodiazotropha taylori]MBT2995288.1 class I SAM-dependent methyltransferase [Candidatus Thiodiazotropha taylori]MBT3002894.1 class I SAM-dependent methyltransferase [Candidatus Thiodiazotropha taylori]